MDKTFIMRYVETKKQTRANNTDSSLLNIHNYINKTVNCLNYYNKYLNTLHIIVNTLHNRSVASMHEVMKGGLRKSLEVTSWLTI